jgi:hypothetical protein
LRLWLQQCAEPTRCFVCPWPMQVLQFVGRASKGGGNSIDIAGVILDLPRDVERFRTANGEFEGVKVGATARV